MTEPKGVYAIIGAIQGELAKTGIAKEGVNQSQNYRFRGIDQVYSALSPLLAKHGLCILPRMVGCERAERATMKPGYNGGPAKESVLFYVTVEAEFDFVSAHDGSSHTVRTFGEAMDSGDKATNKAMSAAYKYAAFMAFAIPTEGDNDADASTHEVAPQEPAARTKLEGVHSSKTALRNAINDIIAKVRTAQSEREIDAIQKENIETIKQANRDWPLLLTGDPGIVEDVGLKGAVEIRRAEVQDRGQFQMLLDSMKSCTSLKSYTNWRATNEAIVDELDDAQRREFEREADAFEAGLTAVDAVRAG